VHKVAIAQHAVTAVVTLGISQLVTVLAILAGVTALALTNKVPADNAIALYLVVLSYIFGRVSGVAQAYSEVGAPVTTTETHTVVTTVPPSDGTTPASGGPTT
jgi:hypothetical protein